MTRPLSTRHGATAGAQKVTIGWWRAWVARCLQTPQADAFADPVGHDSPKYGVDALTKNFFRKENLPLFFMCMLTALGSVAVLCRLAPPVWETNDDVAMSMIAHGYGMAAQSSPDLLFSNVLWGYLVRFIPTVGGTLGYSIATLGVLTIVAATILYGLIKCDRGYVIALAMMLLLMVRSIAFPQFTINAGLLTVSAVLCWRVAAMTENFVLLAAGCLLGFSGYLIRSQEALLVWLVAMPLLPWRFITLPKALRILVAALIVPILLATFVNYQAYQHPEWKAFNTFNAARIPITDFGADVRLEQRPDILHKYGYTLNDIRLLRRWFFLDPSIADAGKLQAMLRQLGPRHLEQPAFNDALHGISPLWDTQLIVLLFAALSLWLLRSSWRVGASWALSLIAFSLIGFLGRPGITRIYVPVLALLVVAPFLIGRMDGWRHRLAAGIVVFAATFQMHAVFYDSSVIQIDAERARSALTGFPSYPVVTWGDDFPFAQIYPVLGASGGMSYRFFALGTFMLAPFSAYSVEHADHHGILDSLRAPSGMPIIASGARMDELKIYCRERMDGNLIAVTSEHFGQISLNHVRCEAR